MWIPDHSCLFTDECQLSGLEIPEYVDSVPPVTTHIPEEISAFPATKKKELAKTPKNTHYNSKKNLRVYFLICCHLSSVSVTRTLFKRD